METNMDEQEEISNDNNKRNLKKISMLDFVEFLSSDSDSDSDIEIQQPGTTEETIVDCAPKHYEQTVIKKSDEKKKETLSLIQQLHTHIVSLEKEKKSLLHSKHRQDGRVYGELEDIEGKQHENRRKEKIQIRENLSKITTKIGKFKREKFEVRKCASYLEKLKLLMEDIEENIQQFKEKHRIMYEDLMTNEKSLTSDMEAFENKINQWQKPPAKSIPVEKGHEKDKKENNLPEEVEEFENFLVLTGGHQGGWDELDHQVFLKLRKQNKKDDQLLAACLRDIPTQVEEDIEQHIQWHQEYCILREHKRDAIRLWKNFKKDERVDVLRNVELDNMVEEKKRKKKEDLLEREREERFEKLKGYKADKDSKERKERKTKEELDKQMKDKLKTNHTLEEKKRLELKHQIDVYRGKKRDEEDILRQAQEEKLEEGKQIVSTEERNRIKERNSRIVKSKQQHKQTKEREEEEKEKRLEKLRQKVVVNVERDPNRLFKLTAGWQHRKDDNECKPNSAVAGSRLMPHRAVPSWRQGMGM